MELPFRFSEADTKERRLIHGAVFLQVQGDRIEYSVWIPSGTVQDSILTLGSTLLGDSFEISLDFSSVTRLPGCGDLAPINPWLPVPPGFSIGLPGSGGTGWVTCPAFEEYEIFRGSLESEEIVALLTGSDDVRASLPGKLDRFLVTGPWAGGFVQIPEPHLVSLIFPSVLFSILRRRRSTCRHARESEAEQAAP